MFRTVLFRRSYFSVFTVMALQLFFCTPPGTRTASSSEATPSVAPDTTGERTIFRQNRTLGKCMNLGNALDAPHEGEWGVTLQEAYFTHVKELGFQSVRIPVRWSTHVADSAPWTISDTFFTRVVWAVDQAMKNGLRAIIDVHHFEGLMSDPKTNVPVLLSIWKQVAERFSSYGPELYFEVCNEPSDQMTPIVWDSVAQQALAIIRETNPTRSVIIGPTRWNSDNAVNQLTFPEDTSLILTFHYYKPSEFTHQGAMWVPGSDLWKGIRWRATYGDTMAVVSHFDGVDRWARSHDIPVFLGEFGAHDTADTVSRVLYTSFIAKQALARGWSYAYWKYNNNFGIYDDSTRVTREYLVNALLKPESTFTAWRTIAAADTAVPSTGSDTFMVLDDFDDAWPDRITLFNAYVAHSGKCDGLPEICQWSTWYQRPGSVKSSQGARILSVSDLASGGRTSNFQLLVGESGFKKAGLHAVVRLKGDSYPTFNLSTSLTGEYNKDWFDFSPLTAVSFYAKGRGMMRVNFITDTVLNGYASGENWGHFGCDFTLTPEWKEYVIPASDFLPKPWSKTQQDQVTWADGMKKVTSIEFASSQFYDQIADDSLDVYLDEIKLWGMTEEMFLPR